MLPSTLALLLLNPTFTPVAPLWPSLVQEAPAGQEQKSPWPETPRTLVSEDYKHWERLGRTDISNDGKWVSGMVSLVDGNPYTIVKQVDESLVMRFDNAVSTAFSDDSQWAAVSSQPDRAEIEKLRAAKKPVPVTLDYWKLPTGDKKTISNIGSFQFIKGSHYLAVTRRPANPAPNTAGDLQLINLKTGEVETMMNVQTFSVNDGASLMSVSVLSSTGEQGLKVVDLATLLTKSLFWGKSVPVVSNWADDGSQLIVAMGDEDDKKEGNSHRLFLFSDPMSGKPTAEFNPATDERFPKGWRISESGGLRFSDDGSVVFFGAQEWKDKKKPSAPEKDKAGVEIWNTADVTPVPQQKRQAGGERFRTISYAWIPASQRLVKLTDNLDQRAITGKSNYALVIDSQKHATAQTDGIGYADVWSVNLATGEKRVLLERSPEASISIGDTGRYVSNYRDRHWWVIDLATGKQTRLTAKGVTFEDKLDDSPAKIKGSGGRFTWLRDDEGFVVEDRYDVFSGSVDKAELTRLSDFGSKNISVRYRQIEDMDGELPRVDGRHYFSVQDETSKATGMAASEGLGQVKLLTMSTDRLQGVRKAKNADRMMMVRQSWELSPQIEVTDINFSVPNVLVSTNHQQQYYKWGKASIVEYRSKWGVPLQGALITPADYDPSKKYPMVVYIYERVSDSVNGYSSPSETNAYSTQVLSQNGYFVLYADIAYRTNDPGVSAVECLEPAVEAAIKANKSIDAGKVGLIGHSWGAYQTAFVTTVSKKFAVGACGAPLTEMTSMYNSFYWNAGVTNQIIFEQSQGRFDAPFWDIPEKYIQNSPVWRSKERTVPLLVAFGDQDGAVDWSQGQFLFNTLRRMGKKSVMLLYAGENHGLAQKGNQLDYAERLRHYLDVYLKGAKPEDWVEKGVSFSDQSGG